MKVWKVILAALVIFAAGVVTGGLTVRLRTPHPAPANGSVNVGPLRPHRDLLDRMQRQLYLTPTQREHIEKILRDNHERMKQLWDTIAPQAQEERRRVHELIRAELRPEQRERFEEMVITRGPIRPGDDRRRREDWREPRGPRRSDASASSNSIPKAREQ